MPRAKVAVPKPLPKPSNVLTLLDDWKAINQHLSSCTIDEVAELLRAEIKREPRRPDYLRRLLGRYRRLRNGAEEIELLSEGKLPWEYAP